MNRLFKTEGIVIRKTNFGETDQILTLVTPDLGKISLLAKGSRRLPSQFCGRVGLLYQIAFTGYQGKGLGYLREAEIVRAEPFEKRSGKIHAALFYIAELTGKLLPEGQMTEGVYELLGQTLLQMQIETRPVEIAERYAMELLCRLGFLPPSPVKNLAFALNEILSKPLRSEAMLKQWI